MISCDDIRVELNGGDGGLTGFPQCCLECHSVSAQQNTPMHTRRLSRDGRAIRICCRVSWWLETWGLVED